ncbi:MAG: hypothetical protein Hyperionvirus9_5 [Hyperionvirus sp.]|uniref:Uncharacterized protein n=1 Tax=Hyperionvirus sp. TaxID=2487770 RepID=A0A3G5A8L8_9VIRU|nr:MAG: hypothetical protein Hyperionvirus9_5 [Hyperionvirus sp.]
MLTKIPWANSGRKKSASTVNERHLVVIFVSGDKGTNLCSFMYCSSWEGDISSTFRVDADDLRCALTRWSARWVFISRSVMT